MKKYLLYFIPLIFLASTVSASSIIGTNISTGGTLTVGGEANFQNTDTGSYFDWYPTDYGITSYQFNDESTPGEASVTRLTYTPTTDTSTQQVTSYFQMHVNGTHNITTGSPAYGLNTLDLEYDNSGSGVVDYASELFIEPSNVGGGLTNFYGINIQDQTGATNNYAIKTGLGRVSFGDKVGIGTTSPQTSLDISADANNTDQSSIRFDDTGSDSSSRNWMIGNSPSSQFLGALEFLVSYTKGGDPGTNGGIPVMELDQNYGAAIGSAYAGSVYPPADGLLVEGNVGIGTSTPQSKLQVSAGGGATTTITIGELGLTSSKTCINGNRDNGQPVSFYFNAAGNGIIVEPNYCR